MVEAGVRPHTDVDVLRAGAARLGLHLTDHQLQQLMAYLELMVKWGSTFNLTSVRDQRDMVTTHLLDCLAIIPHVVVHGSGHWLDAGSGAGLPGIVLAIACPDIRFTTVDAVHKKIAFQTQVKGTLKLSNLQPVHARMQALTRDMMLTGAVFRAFAPLGEGLAELASVLASGAHVVAMKGDLKDAELTQISDQWQLDGVEQLVVPDLDARRCAVLLTRR